VGLGEGVSAACWVPPFLLPEEAEEEGVEDEPPVEPPPPLEPQPPTADQRTAPSTAMMTTAAMSAKSRRRRYTRDLRARRTRRPGGLELRLGLLIKRQSTSRSGRKRGTRRLGAGSAA